MGIHPSVDIYLGHGRKQYRGKIDRYRGQLDSADSSFANVKGKLSAYRQAVDLCFHNHPLLANRRWDLNIVDVGVDVTLHERTSFIVLDQRCPALPLHRDMHVKSLKMKACIRN
jgi:hypothetical protein